MIKFSFKKAIDAKPLLKEVYKANRIAFKASAKIVQKEAKKLVSNRVRRARRRKGGPAGRSKPGQPPYRETGNLRRSIKYDIKRTVALVGPAWPEGAHGSILKWGRRPGARTGELKPRPFMQPALENMRGRLPDKWKNRL